MQDERSLRRLLREVPLVEKSGSFYRSADFSYVGPALQRGELPRVLAGLGSFKWGGRYNPPQMYVTLYAACSQDTAYLEGQSRLTGLALLLFTIEGQLSKVLDLADPQIQQRLGVTDAELEEPWELTQAAGREAKTQILGRLAYESGRIEAMHYKSTKDRPDGRCVAIFLDRIKSPSWLRVPPSSGLSEERIPWEGL